MTGFFKKAATYIKELSKAFHHILFVPWQSSTRFRAEGYYNKGIEQCRARFDDAMKNTDNGKKLLDLEAAHRYISEEIGTTSILCTSMMDKAKTHAETVADQRRRRIFSIMIGGLTTSGLPAAFVPNLTLGIMSATLVCGVSYFVHAVIREAKEKRQAQDLGYDATEKLEKIRNDIEAQIDDLSFKSVLSLKNSAYLGELFESHRKLKTVFEQALMEEADRISKFKPAVNADITLEGEQITVTPLKRRAGQ